MRLSVLAIGLCFALFLGACDRQETPPPPKTAEAPAAPETAAQAAPTAQDQPATEADVKIVQEIRQSVIKDDALSTSARNITIVSQAGKVTLRGSVEDQAEKELLAARAQVVDGVKSVDNQLVTTR